MRICSTSSVKLGRGLTVWFLTVLTMGGASAQRENYVSEEGQEVLTSGPVHEAFANLSESETSPGVVISRQPPDEIEELPPDQRPEGDNVSWIPGYWNWDDDREDYIWISGVWRDLPPNRQWVPGYWTDVRGGSQFVSGFWADVSRNEVEYLPQPPEPLEMGPSSPPIGSNYNWSSGSWVWVDTRYAWQPGYWVPMQPDWVWTPARYVWTPRGYVYVSGYWDHDIIHRGVMFAPVYYSAPVYRQPSYRYSPRIVIDISVVLGHFFINWNTHHYYYGDYYDSHYRDRGYEPWYSRYDRHDRRDRRDRDDWNDRDDRRNQYYREDPLYASYRSQQLSRDPDWDKHIEERYEYRREHTEARPPRTYTQQIEASRVPRTDATRERVVVAAPLDEVVTSEARPRRFERVDADRRAEIETRSRDVRQFRTERKQIEEERDTGVEVARETERTRQPAPPKDDQPKARDADQVQPERVQTQTRPNAPDQPTEETVRRARPSEGQTRGRDATQTQPGQERVVAKPDAGTETARSVQPTRPVRKPLRESPIAAKRESIARPVPPAPDIPRPDATKTAPAEDQRRGGPGGRERPADKGDARQDRPQGHDAKPERTEKAPKDDTKGQK